MSTPVVEQLDTAAARRLVSEARNALALADDLLARLYAGRAWLALGHADWPALCAAELPELRHLKLRAPAREARAAALLAVDPQLTVRDLAAATGASVGTAHRTLQGFTAASGDVAAAASAPAGSRVGRTLELLAAAGPAGLTVEQLRRRTRWHHGAASAVLSRLAAAGRIAYRPGPRRGIMGTYVLEGER